MHGAGYVNKRGLNSAAASIKVSGANKGLPMNVHPTTHPLETLNPKVRARFPMIDRD